MPKFMDHHPKMPPMPPEMMKQQQQRLQQIQAAIKAKQADKFGVTILNVIMAGNGEAWCLTEAANADAVVKSHAANGVQLQRSEVLEVNTLA